MAEENPKDEQDCMDEMTERMLFGEGIDSLTKDGFLDPTEENRIFMEVFYGTSVDDASNCNVASYAVNSQSDKGSQSKSLANVDFENSVLTSYSSMKDSLGQNSFPANVYFKELHGSDSFLDSSSWAGSDVFNWNLKQMKFLPSEQVTFICEEQARGFSDTNRDRVGMNQVRSASTVSLQYPFNLQESPWQITETCGQGTLSGFSLYKGEGEIDGNGNMDDSIPLNDEFKIHDLHVTLVPEAKSVTSPVSQESSVSGLLMAGTSIHPIKMTEMLVRQDHCKRNPSITDSNTMDFVSKRPLIKDLPDRLRSHAHLLLKDAGWRIEPRVRSDRAKLASYFIAPKEKRVITSLSQAWKLCGQRLRNAVDKENDENGREWTNIDTFWFDLTDTLIFIEKEIQVAENSISLLRRWQLLDPFIAVVCINRNISVLREGRAVKAVNSATFVLSRKNNTTATGLETGDHLATPNLCSVSCLDQYTLPALPFDNRFETNDVPGKQQGIQHYDYLQSGSCNQEERKLSWCAGKQCGLKELQRHIVKGLHHDGHSFHMSNEVLVNQHNKENASMSQHACSHRHSETTYSEDLPVNDISAGASLMPGAEISSTDDPEASKFTSMPCVQKASLPCGSNAEVLVETKPYKGKPIKKDSREGKKRGPIVSANCELSGKHPPKAVSYKLSSNVLDPSACWSAADSMTVDNEQTEKDASIYQPESDDVFLTFGRESEKVASIDGSKCEELNSSGKSTASAKRARKKSKKISEIGATNITNSCDAKHADSSDIPDVEKFEDHLQLPYSHQESDTLFCKSSSFLHDKKHACALPENFSVTGKLKKAVKSGTKTRKQHIKEKNKKQTTSMDDTPIASLLITDNDESDMHHQKKNKCDSPLLNSKILNSSRKSMPLSSKKVQHECADSEDLNFASEDGDNGIKSHVKAEHEENFIPPFGVSSGSQETQKVAKPKKFQTCKKSGQKRPRGLRIKDDDLLIAAIIKNKDYSSCGMISSSKVGTSQSKMLKKLESRKGSCKLLPRTPGKGGKLSKEGKGVVLGARTVLCWLIERGVLSLKDVIQYRNSKNNTLVKDGRITMSGILCSCCTKLFSVSEFKAHSGSKLQKPSPNLFLQSGRSYTLCQLQAWSAEYKARKGRMKLVDVEEVDQNDDTCGVCGDGGELICCDSCPSTYHQSCLPTQDLPEGSWYCHNCICRSCWGAVNSGEASNSMVVLECLQCEHKYHDGCINGQKISCGEVGYDTWFCGRNCQEVYSGLRSRVGLVNHLDDGFCWTILRCNHDDQKVHSAQKIALMAECNTKLAIALSIMEECFLPMVDPRTGIDMIPHVLYNWGSSFTRLNYQGFYTVILEKGDELVAVASIRIHGVTAAEMPLIATCSEHRRKGMCRRLMDAVEKMLKSFKVRMLVLSAIPTLVETWTLGFGFKPIKDDERKQLNNVNLMLFPGTTLLIKNLEEVGESGEKTASHLRENKSKNVDGFDEIVNVINAQQDDKNVKTSSDTEALLPINRTLPAEKVNKQQGALVKPSMEIPASISKLSNHDVVNSTEFLCMDESCLSEESEQVCMSVANEFTLHSSVASVCDLASDSQLPAKHNSSISNGSMEVAKPGLNMLVDACVRQVKEQDVVVLSVYSEVKEKGIDNPSEEGCLSYGHALDVCDLNQMDDTKLKELSNSKVFLDDSSTCKDDICGKVGWHPGCKLHSTGNIEA